MKNKLLGFLIIMIVIIMLIGCDNNNLNIDTQNLKSDKKEKILNYGTTVYGVEMGNAGLNPHNNYSGWSTVRYGVGETLFKFVNSMEIEPWLAKDYEQINEFTLKINIRDDVFFSNGRKVDGQAVKECLEHLITTHDRASEDLKIKEIKADGQSITIISKEETPTLLNYLSDPYGAIIDMNYGITEDGNVVGTGPFIANKVTNNEINLIKNNNYWGGKVNLDKINIKAITDKDTLTMALQSGEIDVAQGLPYLSIPLFENNKDYKISSKDTSRTLFATMNYKTDVLKDINVRKAIAMGIDKQSFTDVLLQENGTAAIGPFPLNFTFGDKMVTAPQYDEEEAKKLLAKSGWIDTNGDGYVDKDGKNLKLRWLTYSGRQELPILAEAVQASLKKIGIDIEVNSSVNHLNFIENGQWDIYASSFVTAPTGDPAYFFTTHTLKNSTKNRGNYYNEKLEKLAIQLSKEFDINKRSKIAVNMEKIILDDVAFIFVSHLKMSFVMKSSVSGFEAHSSDYYEVTANLDIN